MDLSKLSDEELRRLAGRQEIAQRRVRDLSDDELRALAQPAQVQGPPMPEQSLLQRASRGVDDATRMASSGITFGFADRARALGGAVGQSLAGEGFDYSKQLEVERGKTAAARDRMGNWGTALEILGGAGTGVGLASAGATAARFIPQALTGGKRLGALMGAGAVDGAALGAISAAGNTDTMEALPGAVGSAAAFGGVAGAAAPALVAGIGRVVQPARDAIENAVNPDGIARRLATRAMERADVTPDVIRQRLAAAQADGQTSYMAVDAMGDGGARALNSVARGDSPAASRIKDAFDARQAGQADRLEGIVREGLDAPTTAAQLEQKLTGIRQAKGNAAYPEAAREAAPVDLSPAIAQLDRRINPAGIPSTLDDNPTQSALRGVRGQITNDKEQLTDFERARQAFMATRDAADEAFRSGAGAKGNALKETANDMRKALEAAYPQFAKDQHAQSNLFRATEAIEKGKELAGRKALSQDVSDAARSMTPQELGAARYGYADELIARMQSARQGSDKSAPLTTGKLDDDLSVLARKDVKPKLQRERDMAETRRIITGGSQTAQNLADMGLAAGAGGMLYMNPTSPEGLIAAALAARRGLARIPPSEAAREALARALMSNSADDLASMAAKQVKARAFREEATNPLVRALLGATAVGVAQ